MQTIHSYGLETEKFNMNNRCWQWAKFTGSALCKALVVSSIISGCGSIVSPVPDSLSTDVASDVSVPASEWFVDIAQESGLDFIHFNGRLGNFYQPEIMGPGVGLFDYDNDGDLDIYLVQGRMLDLDAPMADVNSEGIDPDRLQGRLYENQLHALDDETNELQFVDVTRESGIVSQGYGMGVATGDFDNDGCVDLYLTHVGSNQLFRNNCDGTFSDVSGASGINDEAWSVGAAFIDVDRDGWLDLFVANYLIYSVERNVSCAGESGQQDYCPPERYRPAPDRFYKNQGDGTFLDLTGDVGLAGAYGPGLGVSTADFNGDGWIDIFVANDQQENQLWINRRDGTFDDVALLAGTALGASGALNADMGVDAGDFDNDGDEDLFVTELTGQGSMLYVNDGSAQFEEQSARVGIRLASLPYTGFGAGWLDFDNDGWLDIFSANGFVTQNLDALSEGNPFPLQQQNLLLRNRGAGSFEDVSSRAGPAMALSEVSRGTAFGDIDNDGDIDIVVANDNGPVRLLMNQIGNKNSWIGLRLVGHVNDGDERDMLGARVEIVRHDGVTLWRRSRADGSYASASDPRVLAGLGDEEGDVSRIRVEWPSGRVEEWTDPAVGRYTTLVEGSIQ